jgi:hypothetical protein
MFCFFIFAGELDVPQAVVLTVNPSTYIKICKILHFRMAYSY